MGKTIEKMVWIFHRKMEVSMVSMEVSIEIQHRKWCGFSISMFDYPSAASWAIGETLPAPFMAYAALEQPRPNDNHGLLG